jgi:hypothetical protein
MDGLRLNFQGTTRLFTPDGNVTVDGQAAVKGSWRTAAQGAEARENKIRYTFDGAPQPDVPVTYSLNDKNQLVAVIPAAANGGANSAPFAFLGSVEVDDAHDLVYNLLGLDGKPLPKSITVYGDLKFAENTNNLVVALTGGGSAELKGASGITSVEAARNNLPGFKSSDLLKFHAFTENKLSTGQSKFFPAKIGFAGKWDLQGDQLVFVSEVKGTLQNSEVTIGFGGQYKAVSGGLVYYADKNGTQLAFNVNGSHTWNSGTAKWDVSVGYTGKKFSATLSGNLKIDKKFEDGRQLLLTGDLAIDLGNTSKTVKMEVNAVYTWSKDNKLVVQALVSGTNQALNYDLKVEGKFVFKSGTLTFSVRYSNKEPDDKFQFEIAFQGNQSSLIKALSIVLDVKEGEVKLTFQFEMRMVWVNGKLVKQPPQAA